MKNKKQLVPILVELDVLDQLKAYDIKFEVLLYPSDEILKVIKPEYRPIFFKWLCLCRESHILEENKFHSDHKNSNGRLFNLWVAFLYKRGFFVERHNGRKFSQTQAFIFMCEHFGKEHFSRKYYWECKGKANDTDYIKLPGMTTITLELEKRKL